MQHTRLALHTASSEEIKYARVADVYFHRTIEVLRARGAEDIPVHAELTLESGDPDKWFVVAGIEEMAHLLEGPE